MKRSAAQTLFPLALFVFSLSLSAYGQDSSATTAAPQTTADENFTLNIKEERVTETNYERSTAVEVGDRNKAAGLLVRVGATVRAQRIDIILRGITGSGRFRASLETIRRLLDERGVKLSSEP